MSNPPHTIQRLAELVLEPTKYYRTLPAWLRAVDRVVNVSSSADIFPLNDTPPLANGVVNGEGGGGIFWNNKDTRSGSEYDSDRLGSDESLGGALLTPIPWLRNGGHSTEELDDDTQESKESDSDGLGDPLELPSTSPDNNASAAAALENSPHDPLVPERKDGAVTQGELMRMEQEAGVMPVNPSKPNTWEGEDDGDDIDELVPHARGPDVVGAVDMGKVDGHEVEVNIGSPPDSRGQKTADPNDAQEVLSHDEIKGGSESSANDGFEIIDKDDDEMQLDLPEKSNLKDEDEDMVLVDADGKTDAELKHGEQGEEVGTDATDAST